jgi:hypothetical protein
MSDLKVLPRPDLRHTGIGAEAKFRICKAIADAFTASELQANQDNAARCHCGRCGRYARCKFRTPRCPADVVHNVVATGCKAAARVGTVGTMVDHFRDDVVVSFGMGAGSCVAGWQVARGAKIEQLFGVEVEPLATKVALSAFPGATIAPSVRDIALPAEGRLIGITSLVFNVVSSEIAREWARFLASARSTFLHINIGRVEEPGVLSIFERALIEHGLQPRLHDLPANIDNSDCGYATMATWWGR